MGHKLYDVFKGTEFMVGGLTEDKELLGRGVDVAETMAGGREVDSGRDSWETEKDLGDCFGREVFEMHVGGVSSYLYCISLLVQAQRLCSSKLLQPLISTINVRIVDSWTVGVQASSGIKSSKDKDPCVGAIKMKRITRVEQTLGKP